MEGMVIYCEDTLCDGYTYVKGLILANSEEELINKFKTYFASVGGYIDEEDESWSDPECFDWSNDYYASDDIFTIESIDDIDGSSGNKYLLIQDFSDQHNEVLRASTENDLKIKYKSFLRGIGATEDQLKSVDDDCSIKLEINEEAIFRAQIVEILA